MTKRHTCGWQSHATNHKCHQSPSTTTRTSLVMNGPSHTSIHTHTIVHTHVVGWWWRDWKTTVMTNTPWFHGNHSLHQHHCDAQHPHPANHSCRLLGGALTIHMPLCVHHKWLGKRGVVRAMCCHSTPFTLVHPFTLLTLCVSLALTLCQTHSPVNE